MIIKVNNRKIKVEVADNIIKRMMGLSFSEKKNMFFPMEFESRWSMWMFAVNYEIKMIFIDSDKKVVDILEGVPITPDPRTWKVYTPKKPCKYILETPFDIKVKIGDRVSW
jgi:uncharacterized membrane protein (UPF0127 family)